ncbi:MAG: hypothetical protein GY732_06535 [Gammaproteobacteria bacterium]|nr:hypothetical protein [Gammaproteobacteria bacterium]
MSSYSLSTIFNEAYNRTRPANPIIMTMRNCNTRRYRGRVIFSGTVYSHALIRDEFQQVKNLAANFLLVLVDVDRNHFDKITDATPGVRFPSRFLVQAGDSMGFFGDS